MASSTGRLSPLQSRILREFFAREQAFFLTGGAALAGFHLHHRRTDDLDLFTPDDDGYERGHHVLGDVAHALGGELQTLLEAPGFRRHAIRCGEELVVVDLVRDRTEQCDKEVRDGIRVDTPEEIMANINTILSRAEERDLVDLLFLERTGRRVEDALGLAQRKDGGCTPATLAWLLSEVTIPDGIELPGGLTPTELRAFVADLIVRFRGLAYPGA